MTKKDYIKVADACIANINKGNVKKKDIMDFINTTIYYITESNFNRNVFVQYVLDGTKKGE
jgi:hypothetical protein